MDRMPTKHIEKIHDQELKTEIKTTAKSLYHYALISPIDKNEARNVSKQVNLMIGRLYKLVTQFGLS